MTEEQRVIWVAGLLEGEGCFRVKPGSRAGYRAMLVVNVCSTDKDVIERCCGVFPNHSKIHSRKPGNYKRQYAVEWYGKNAEHLMRVIRPYMCARRARRIDECLNTTNLSHHPGRQNTERKRGSDGRFVKDAQ